jgi:tetratricopeptide (TPR) repeat protein
MIIQKCLFVIFSIIFVQTTFGQSNVELAKSKALEAYQFEAKGKVEEAIKLLNEAIKLDPSNIDYPIRIACGYTFKNDYNNAIKILDELTKHKNVNDMVYQDLGNNYHYKGSAKKAIKTYNKGLTLFPNSGKLYCEIGNVYNLENKYYIGIDFYEKAIKVEPTFVPSYYRLSKIYCIGTTLPIWGFLYGEIYMNVEDEEEELNLEISHILFRTLKYSIIFDKDSLKKVGIYDYRHSKDKNFNFGIWYEDLFRKSITKETKIDIASLNTIRTKFLDLYNTENVSKKYANALIEYQNKVKNAGHFEAYNYWLFRHGDVKEFEKWQKENKQKWDSFIEWFKQNKIQISNENKFFKDQY